jgi:simple sugar transport system ATP-binding protein
VAELTLAEKQMVLIARATVERCRFLILDEPTAPLSDNETKELFRIVRELSAGGVGIVFISHRIQELLQICGSITILKDGELVKTMPLAADITSKAIVELMLGRKFEETFPKRIVPIGDVLLDVENLSERHGRVKRAGFTVRRGEIVGISGLVGAGKTELCKTLFGALRRTAGTVRLSGRELRISSPHQAVRQGLALVPEERRKEGVLVDEPVFSNLSAPSLAKYCGRMGFIGREREREMSARIVGELGIKTPSMSQKVAYLSGGNQQKIVVGKWLVADAEVYIFDEATKGVDVAAKHDIFELIQQLAGMGKGIVYASSELSEILTITDRTYVMFDGEIRRELVTRDTTDEEILHYATGGR